MVDVILRPFTYDYCLHPIYYSLSIIRKEIVFPPIGESCSQVYRCNLREDITEYGCYDSRQRAWQVCRTWIGHGKCCCIWVSIIIISCFIVHKNHTGCFCLQLRWKNLLEKSFYVIVDQYNLW